MMHHLYSFAICVQIFQKTNRCENWSFLLNYLKSIWIKHLLLVYIVVMIIIFGVNCRNYSRWFWMEWILWHSSLCILGIVLRCGISLCNYWTMSALVDMFHCYLRPPISTPFAITYRPFARYSFCHMLIVLLQVSRCIMFNRPLAEKMSWPSVNCCSNILILSR